MGHLTDEDEDEVDNMAGTEDSEARSLWGITASDGVKGKEPRTTR